MYPSTKSAAAGSGTVTSLDSTRNTNEVHTIHAPYPTLQLSHADLTALGPEYDDVALELATGSPSSSTEAGLTGVSNSSLSVNADSHPSAHKLEHAIPGTKGATLQAAYEGGRWSNSHVGYGLYNTALSSPTNSLSVNAGGYISASETSQVIEDIISTATLRAGTHLHLNHGTSTAYNRTVFPTDLRSHASQSLLQLWAYETSPRKLTLAEHLEQANWEDDSLSNYTPAANPPKTTDAMATYEGVMENEWYVTAVL